MKFYLFATGIAFISLIMYTLSYDVTNTFYKYAGGIDVIYDSNQQNLICGEVHCPYPSFSCAVAQYDIDISYYERYIECLDRLNTTLLHKKFYLKNEIPYSIRKTSFVYFTPNEQYSSTGGERTIEEIVEKARKAEIQSNENEKRLEKEFAERDRKREEEHRRREQEFAERDRKREEEHRRREKEREERDRKREEEHKRREKEREERDRKREEEHRRREIEREERDRKREEELKRREEERKERQNKIKEEERQRERDYVDVTSDIVNTNTKPYGLNGINVFYKGNSLHCDEVQCRLLSQCVVIQEDISPYYFQKISMCFDENQNLLVSKRYVENNNPKSNNSAFVYFGPDMKFKSNKFGLEEQNFIKEKSSRVYQYLFSEE